MSTKNSDAAPTPALAPLAGSTPALGEPVKVGDRIKLRVVVGGPAIATIEAEVIKVHKSTPAGKSGGPFLDVECRGRDGTPWTATEVGPEPPEGANMNTPGAPFPCWARSPAPK